MSEAKGFAAMNPIIHKFASAKGGKRKVPKGLAKLPPERRREIASRGGKAKYENRNTGTDSSTEK